MRRSALTFHFILTLSFSAFSEEHGSEGEYYEDAPAGYQADESFSSQSQIRTELDSETTELFEEVRFRNPQVDAENFEVNPAMPAIESTVQFEVRRSSEPKKVLVLEKNAAAGSPLVLTGSPGSASATATVYSSFLSGFPTLPAKPGLSKSETSPPQSPSAPEAEERRVRKFQKVFYIPSNGGGEKLSSKDFSKNGAMASRTSSKRLRSGVTGKSAEDKDDAVVLEDLSPRESEGESESDSDSMADAYPIFTGSVESFETQRNLVWYWVVPFLLLAAFLAGRWSQQKRLLNAAVSSSRKRRTVREDTFAGTIFYKLKK